MPEVRTLSPLRFEVPVKTVSAANLREHHMEKARRVKEERALTKLAVARVESIPPLLEVRLTRVSMGELDDDNLRPALKAIRDQLAAWLRVDDSTPLVRWHYAQAKGPACVRVEVESVFGGLPEDPCARLDALVREAGLTTRIEMPAERTAEEIILDGERRSAKVRAELGKQIDAFTAPKPKKPKQGEPPPAKDWRAMVSPNVRRPK